MLSHDQMRQLVWAVLAAGVLAGGKKNGITIEADEGLARWDHRFPPPKHVSPDMEALLHPNPQHVWCVKHGCGEFALTGSNYCADHKPSLKRRRK